MVSKKCDFIRYHIVEIIISERFYMKMRKRIILFSIILIMILSVPIFAHPGRTDGSGGHTDSDTGEYHYHHGYPAHDHWDIDDDGDIDCPYDFDDQTDHNSGNNSSSGNNTNTYPNYQKDTTGKNKAKNYAFSYVAIGIVIVFFVLVNCLAIYIDRKDKTPREEPISLPSVYISILSTIIVFAVLFGIMFLFKRPVQLREISFEEMLQGLFLSAIFSSLVWFIAGGVTFFINTLLCSLLKLEVHGWSGHFQRLTIPLSYAFTVFLFILQ